MFGSAIAARRTRRPIRPNPLIPILIGAAAAAEDENFLIEVENMFGFCRSENRRSSEGRVDLVFYPMTNIKNYDKEDDDKEVDDKEDHIEEDN